MKYWLLGSVIFVGGLMFAWYQFPVLQTVYLIARITPYEQQPAGATRHLLVLGDSTGYGTGSSNSRFSVAGRIGADFQDLTITNDSVNGRTVTAGLKAFKANHTAASYDVILLQLGANDILDGGDMSVTEDALRELFSLTTAEEKPVFLLASGNIGSAPRFTGVRREELTARTLEYFAVYQSVADEYGVTFINLFKPPESDPFVLQPDLYTAIDGLHPSDAGYAYWYKALAPVLGPTLE